MNYPEVILRDILMQEQYYHNQISTKSEPIELSIEEKQRMANAFLWLIDQDKKQNPAHYKK